MQCSGTWYRPHVHRGSFGVQGRRIEGLCAVQGACLVQGAGVSQVFALDGLLARSLSTVPVMSIQQGTGLARLQLITHPAQHTKFPSCSRETCFFRLFLRCCPFVLTKSTYCKEEYSA